MKKANTVPNADQPQNIKNNFYKQKKCFYCDVTACLHHSLKRTKDLVSGWA